MAELLATLGGTQNYRYFCVGYSRYADRKAQASNEQKTQPELPICVSLLVVRDCCHFDHLNQLLLPRKSSRNEVLNLPTDSKHILLFAILFFLKILPTCFNAFCFLLPLKLWTKGGKSVLY